MFRSNQNYIGTWCVPSKLWLTLLQTSKLTSAKEVGLSGSCLLVTLQPPSQFFLKLSEPSPEVKLPISATREHFVFLYHTQHHHWEEYWSTWGFRPFSVFLAGLFCFTSGRKLVWQGNYLDSRISPGLLVWLLFLMFLPPSPLTYMANQYKFG